MASADRRKEENGSELDGLKKMAGFGRLNSNKIRNAQVIIMVMLGSLLIPMTLVIWFYTSNHEAEQVSRLALPLRDQLLQRSAAHLVKMVESFHTAIFTLAVTLQSEIITSTAVPASGDLWSDNQVLRVLLSTVSANKYISAVVFTRTDGDISAVGGAVTGSLTVAGSLIVGFVQNNTKNAAPLFRWYGRAMNASTGVCYGNVYPLPQYIDARNTPVYLDVIDQPNFGFALSDFALQYAAMISLSMRVLGGGPHQNRTNGVIVSTITTEVLGEFIGDLDLLNGYMYVMNTKGLVIAASPGVYTSVRVLSSFMPVLLPPSKVNHTVISAIGKYLERTTSTQALLIKDIHVGNVKANGKRYYVDTTSVKWRSFLGIVVIIVPRKSILGGVDAAIKNLAVFLFVLAAGTMVVGQFLVMILTRYMGREANLKLELSKEQGDKERAESCSATARSFLKNLSRDLGVPMGAVVAALEVAGKYSLGVEDRSLLEQAQSSASSLQALVNSILDIAAIESGELGLIVAPLNLSNELLDLVDMFSAETMSMGVDVLLELPESLPLVMADKKRVHQIFVNLLSNCIKFTSKGHVVIQGTIKDNHLSGQEDFFTTASLGTFLQSIKKDAGGVGTSAYGHNQQQPVVVWAFQPSMPAESKEAIRSVGCYMVQKPLVASRLGMLMQEIFSGPLPWDPSDHSGPSDASSATGKACQSASD